MKKDFDKITIEASFGTNRQVADRARTTIGLAPGDKEVTDAYMRKLYLSEHSPIRLQSYIIRVEGVPTFIATHFVRHNIGVTPFIQSMRDDRAEYDEIPNRETPVIMELHLNTQAIINISRKRLCHCSHIRTIKVWEAILEELKTVNDTLVSCCVKNCVYQGHCYEYKSCGYHKSPEFEEEVKKHREGINM